ncbi:MAG TPA: hypothetical protein PKD55_13045 [Bellilinea sp.]|nr:hypothetical protein [Bellilinea sp.]
MEKIYKIGEKPGKGTYRCTICSYLAVLPTDVEEVKVCPKCGGGAFVKVVHVDAEKAESKQNKDTESKPYKTKE